MTAVEDAPVTARPARAPRRSGFEIAVGSSLRNRERIDGPVLARSTPPSLRR
jgi:hypothetical protein